MYSIDVMLYTSIPPLASKRLTAIMSRFTSAQWGGALRFCLAGVRLGDLVSSLSLKVALCPR